MARRKKYPKLPSSFGSISFLGKGRRNPYMVRPPVTEFDEDGKPIRPKPICYTAAWLAGFAALNAWKSGTYTPGMEIEFDSDPHGNPSDVVERILADYMRVTKRTEGLTFSEVYKRAYEWKFSHKELSTSAKNYYHYAFQYCESIHNKVFASLRQNDLQKVIDDCNKSFSSKDSIRTMLSMTYKYALSNDIVSVDYSKGLICEKKNIKHGQSFSDEEIKYMWEHSDEESYKQLLIMCYSGFRISAYNDLEINLEEKYFKGGVKTATSKNRIVPIHSAILPLVKDLTDKYGYLNITRTRVAFLNDIRSINKDATPHWTRHTFSALCERYGVRENDRKRMLGHVVGDITNDIYGHRTLEDLRSEIEKIEVQKIAQQEDLGKKDEK